MRVYQYLLSLQEYISAYNHIGFVTLYEYMNLFLQSVSEQGKLLLFDDKKEILASQDINLLLHESSKLISTIDVFLNENHITYENIENICVIHGPGSFTGIRTTTLYVNTLAFIYPQIELTPICFFSLFDTYPICKISSKRDLFVKSSENAIIEVIKNEDFAKEYKGEIAYGDGIIDGVTVKKDINYRDVISRIQLEHHKQIAPLYIKKPNIS